VLAGVAEIDETYVLESFKGRKVVGRKARKRGGRAAKRGLSRAQIPVLVARDRSGATTDYMLTDTHKAAVMAVLQPILPPDAVVCTDGGGSIGQAVKDLGLLAIGAWPHHQLTRKAPKKKGLGTRPLGIVWWRGGGSKTPGEAYRCLIPQAGST
jgi:hypothetical protein